MSQIFDIVRTKDDGSPSENSITLDEWRAVIAADPSLSEFKVPEMPETLAVRWTGHPKRKLVLYSWEDGVINTTYVDDLMLAKTQEIARALKARVRHEEGEFFEDIDLTKRRGCGATALLVVLAIFIVCLFLTG